MKSLMPAKIIVFLILSCPAAFAQGIDNRGQDNAWMTLRTLDGHDYYGTRRDRATKALLKNVENNHLIHVHDDPKGVYGYIQKGTPFYLEHARRNLSFVLKRFPNHPKALKLLTLVAALQKNPSMPISFYQKAIKAYPKYAVTRIEFGKYLLSTGATKYAIANFRNAVKIKPKSKSAHVLLAIAYSRNGNQELAQKYANRARALGYGGKIF